jgi:hypothetical protein
MVDWHWKGSHYVSRKSEFKSKNPCQDTIIISIKIYILKDSTYLPATKSNKVPVYILIDSYIYIVILTLALFVSYKFK